MKVLKIIRNIVKAIFIVFLLAVILNVAGIFTIGKNTKEVALAQEATANAEVDSNFDFSKNNIVLGGLSDYRMGYRLHLKNTDLALTHTLDKSIYTFTLHRVDKSGSSTPVAQYVIYPIENTVYHLYKSYEYEDYNFTFSPVQYENADSTGSSVKTIEGFETYKKVGVYNYTSDNYNAINFDSDNNLDLHIDLNDAYTQYFVRFEYNICKFDKWEAQTSINWLGIFSGNITNMKLVPKYNDPIKGILDNTPTSIYELLKYYDDIGYIDGTLKTQSTEYWALARQIIDNKDVQSVRVKYLEQIKGTPFAKAVYATIDVPVTSTTLPTDRVAAALGKSDLYCINASCLGFEYDSASDTYVAHYQKSVWLSAKTVDGNSENYFLDINKSYADYYGKMVSDGVFSQDLYEYILNGMFIDYRDQLNGLTANDIYGFFGYVVIPDTYTIDALWAEMFDTDRTFKGVIKRFEYFALLDYSSYQKLLTDYEYTWLEKAWNGVSGFVTGGSWSAQHYLFYADGLENEALIAENGATDMLDNDGALSNDIDNILGGNSSNILLTLILVILGLLIAYVTILIVGKFIKVFKW